MAKASGSTRTSTSRNPRGLNEKSGRNVGGNSDEAIARRLSMDEGDAMYARIGDFNSRMLQDSIQNAVDVEIVGVSKIGSLVQVNVMDSYDRDDRVRTITFENSITPVELVRRINRTNFHFGE